MSSLTFFTEVVFLSLLLHKGTQSIQSWKVKQKELAVLICMSCIFCLGWPEYDADNVSLVYNPKSYQVEVSNNSIKTLIYSLYLTRYNYKKIIMKQSFFSFSVKRSLQEW